MWYEISVWGSFGDDGRTVYCSRDLKRIKFIMSLVKEKYGVKEINLNTCLITLYDQNVNRLDGFYAHKSKYEEISKYLNSILTLEFFIEEAKKRYSSKYYDGLLPSKGSYTFYKLVYAYALECYENNHGLHEPKNEIPEYLKMPEEERAKMKILEEKLAVQFDKKWTKENCPEMYEEKYGKKE